MANGRAVFGTGIKQCKQVAVGNRASDVSLVALGRRVCSKYVISRAPSDVAGGILEASLREIKNGDGGVLKSKFV